MSHSGVGEVAKYIADQEEHHRKKTFAEAFRLFVERYELKWHDDKTVETVAPRRARPSPTLNVGVNESAGYSPENSEEPEPVPDEGP